MIKTAIKYISNILIISGIFIILVTFVPVFAGEVWYFFKNIRGQIFFLDEKPQPKPSIFARYLTSTPLAITPINKDFSIVIEKIGVNAPIVANVSVTNEDEYNKSLKNGIAHAIGTSVPGEKGNVYLFAHSSVNFWSLGRYATVFNLLRKLENGDNIHVFYEGKHYTYSVINKEIVEGWDTYTLSRVVLDPILTLQTCDPPGTTLNRLVVTAKLVSVE